VSAPADPLGSADRVEPDPRRAALDSFYVEKAARLRPVSSKPGECPKPSQRWGLRTKRKRSRGQSV